MAKTKPKHREGTDGRAHARLSASESKRWINCPGSVREIDVLPEELKRKSSVAADEGTAAHALAEICLAKGVNARSMLDKNVGGFIVDENMADAVQVYLDVVAHIKDMHPDGDFNVEKQFILDWIHEDCFGTNDFSAAVIFGTLYVVDYKHGRGIVVDVEENTQLMYYALGAAKDYEFNFDEVVLMIVQPRCRHGGTHAYDDRFQQWEENGVRTWSLSASDLEKWGEEVLRPAAYATQDPTAPLVPGSWCKDSFCPAYATCPALFGAAMDQAQIDFADEPYDIPEIGHNNGPDKGETAEEYGLRLSRAKKWTPALKAWLSAVEKQAYQAAECGIEIPEFKIVEKESDRSWAVDEPKLVKELKKVGLTVDQMYADPPPPKLKSPAQMEKLGKPVKTKVKELVKRETTGRILVPENDKRPAVGASLESEFEPVDEDTID